MEVCSLHICMQTSQLQVAGDLKGHTFCTHIHTQTHAHTTMLKLYLGGHPGKTHSLHVYTLTEGAL